MAKEELDCSFCGKKKADTNLLIAGIDAHICDRCIEQANGIVIEESKQNKGDDFSSDVMLKKPKEIKAFLDDYIIGQEQTKKVMSVAVYNHYKRLLQTTTEDDIEIQKSNIIIVGQTGTGKTLLAKSIAQLLNVPFCIADATVLTEAGYVGEDVESILSRLLQAADYDVASAERGIVFIDEIDKICKREGSTSGGDVSREGVQRDLLPLVEGSTVSTKHGTVKTDHILFIASGAFQLAKPSDLLPELQGRLPIRVELNALTEGDYKRILKEPDNSLIKQYVALLKTEKVELEFTDNGIDLLAKVSTEVNASVENIGARRLHTLLEKILEDKKYNKDADILNHYAFSLRKTNNLTKAEKIYQKALSIEPTHRGALEYIGELYVDTKRMDLANATLKKLENCKCEEYAELKNYINK